MMKSEWMSKKDVKRRLDSIFGEYSEFVVKPDPQQNAVQHSKSLGCYGTNNFRVCKMEITDDVPQSFAQDGHHISASSNIDSMIGQLVNISKPLSPVTFTQSEADKGNNPVNGIESKMKLAMLEKKVPKFELDVDSILEQISRVSPLISPLSVTDNTTVGNGEPESLSADIKQEDLENNLKRPSNDGNLNVIKSAKRRILHFEENQQNTTKIDEDDNPAMNLYSIKLGGTVFKELAARLCLVESVQKDAQQKDVQSDPVLQQASDGGPGVSIEKARTSNSVSDRSKCRQKPVKKEAIFPSTDSKLPPFDFYQNQAREIRKKSERERDILLQLMLAFESVAYHLMATSTLASKTDKMYSAIAENTNLLNSSWNSFKRKKLSDSALIILIRTRLKYIQMMVSSCLAYNLYSIRSAQAINTYTVLNQYEKENPISTRRPASRTNGNGVGASENGTASGGTTSTPSPTSSTPGSLNSQNTITLPMDIYTTMSQQIRTLHQLMWSFQLWNDVKTNSPEDCKEFFARVALLCVGLEQTSEPVAIAEFLLTCVTCLREEYKAGK